MGLFGPDWKTKTISKLEKALKNVQQITDPSILFEIALTAPLEEVRCSAVRKIHDQQMLKTVLLLCSRPEMAKEIGCPYKALGGDAVRDTAAERLKDPEILKEMLLNHPAAFGTQENIRGAINRIRDPKVIYAILTGKFASEPSQRLSDGSLPFSLIREYALSKIEDPVLLKQLAIGHDGDCVRDAVKKLTEPADLVEVAINTKNNGIADDIIIRIKDPDFLFELLEKTKDREYYSVRNLRHKALGRLSDLYKKSNGSQDAFSDEQHEKYIREFLNSKNPASRYFVSDFKSWEELERICVGAVCEDIRMEAFGILCKDQDYPSAHLLRILIGLQEIKERIDLDRFTLEELEQICYNAACPQLRQSAKDMLLEKLPIPHLHQFCNDFEADKDVRDALVKRLDDWDVSPEDLLEAVSEPEGSFYFRCRCLGILFYRQRFSEIQDIEKIRDQAAEAVLSFIPADRANDSHQHYVCERYLNLFINTVPSKYSKKYGITFWEHSRQGSDGTVTMMDYRGFSFERF